jgi:SAM-dependent methyltransferase
MNADEIRERVASFPQWHYEFDLQGVTTPIWDAGHRNRHRQRVEYFFKPVVELFGGTLEGKRVLDLGCNAGFWSLQAINAGADYVHGVDGRQMHVDQANLVFEALEIERSRYRFEVGNVLTRDFTDLGSFDIVLCLGLLYHIAKPMELFENVAKVSSDILLIDTGVSALPGSVIELRRESTEDVRYAVDYELVMFPTRRAVLDMVGQFGYHAVPLEPQMPSYEGMIDYLTGNRFAFVAARKSDLSTLDAVHVSRLRAKADRLGETAMLAVRSTTAAGRHLARPGVEGRGRVVHDLVAAYRHRAERMAQFPLS